MVMGLAIAASDQAVGQQETDRFIESEAGLIPADWKAAYVEDIATITTGGRNTQDRVKGGVYPFFVRSQNVERINSYSFEKEAVLTAGDGVGTGKIFHYIDGKFDVHQRVYVMSDFVERISGYFFYLVFSSRFYDRIMQMTAKSSVDSVRREMIARMAIPLPPRREQDAIVEALQQAEGLIVALEQLIEKKRLIKQGAMQELLSGHRRLPGFGGDWALTRLGARGAFFKGSGVRRDQAQSGELPCIRYGELYTHFDNVIRTFFSRISPEVAASALKLNRGDILFAGSGETKEEIGKCAVLDAADSAYAGGDIVVFRARDDNPIFLAYYLNSTPLQTQKAAKGQGDAVVHISARALSEAKPRLLCSLVHKFGKRDVEDFDAWIKDMEGQPSPTVGETFVFIDECHRTQSGKLHRAMTAMMPNAVFVGFTGTPLLKKDKKTSMEVFGHYIHTYKFSEAVEDEVVLDLVYEARDIDQRLGSEDRIEAWFDAKTRGLNDWQKDELRKKWGTMQSVLSSRSRMDRVVSDILFDFSTKRRLSSQRGNAILVASSIYEACRYYELFCKTPLKGRCALVTSYNPNTQDVTREEIGANSETDKQFIYNTYTELLKNVSARPGKSKTETYEDDAKDLFTKQPASMKLLIVVDKLLTGFDAPPCTYLYIDKSMQDHGLFQAICRTNRLDGEDKDFGYIVDYKDLFKKVESAIAVYSSELDDSAPGPAPDVMLQDRLTKGKERLDDTLEALELLCEPVDPPKGELDYIHYFCGNTEIPSDLEEREPQRAMLYKAVAAYARAYANIADDMDEAGYSEAEIRHIKDRLDYYLAIREIIRNASGETLDLKAYEADMRHLIDTYIEADEARKISAFDNVSLLDLIVKTGIADAIASKLGSMKGNKEAIAETIENNVRSKIIKEHLNDPAFYDRISALLDEIIRNRREKALQYEDYLKQIADLVQRLDAGTAEDTPEKLDTPGKRALYNNLENDEELALRLDEAVKKHAPDSWRGNEPKERVIKKALYKELGDKDEVERIFLIIKAQKEY